MQTCEHAREVRNGRYWIRPLIATNTNSNATPPWEGQMPDQIMSLLCLSFWLFSCLLLLPVTQCLRLPACLLPVTAICRFQKQTGQNMGDSVTIYKPLTPHVIVYYICFSVSFFFCLSFSLVPCLRLCFPVYFCCRCVRVCGLVMHLCVLVNRKRTRKVPRSCLSGFQVEIMTLKFRRAAKNIQKINRRRKTQKQPMSRRTR